MSHIDILDAQARLEAVIISALPGEEIIITKDSKPIARLLSLPAGNPVPNFGSARGKIFMREDFEDPLEEFQEYMK